MAIISLRGTAYSTGAAFLVPGIPGMLATQVGTPLWWSAVVSTVVGAGILLWAIQIKGKHWTVYIREALPGLRNLFGRHGSLYNGAVFVSDSELDSKHFFDMSIIGFNGTPYPFQTATIDGRVSINFILKGTGQGGFDVRAPVLCGESPKPHVPDKEFTLNTRIFLEPVQVAEYRQREAAGQTPQIMFGETKVELETRRGKRMTLLLWDGVSLSRDRPAVGRIMCLRLQASGTTDMAMGTR